MMCDTKKRRHFAKIPTPRSGFWTDEDGSFSIEAVIWMPIYALVLAVVMNISMMFFNESQMLRVVQDANRAYSLGRMPDTDAVEAYVMNQLAYLNATVTVSSSIDVANGIIATQLSAPATDLMPMNFMRGSFEAVNVNVSAQQIIEF